MAARLPIALLSAAAWAPFALAHAVPADPTITAPAILPRQNAANFMGWLEQNNTWTSLTCDAGNTWYQSGVYAQCCPETIPSCNAPTACVGGSQIYPYPAFATTRTIACTSNYNNPAWSVCNTIFVFESFGDSNPKTDIVCGESSANWSFYRKIPASATETTSSQATTSAAASSGGSGGSSSKAWIAGAVVGPLLGLALVGLIIFFLRRKKSKKARLASEQGTAAMAPLDPSRPPAGVAGYTDAKPQFAADQQNYYPPQPVDQQNYYPTQAADPISPNPNTYSQVYPETSTSPAPQYVAPGSPPPQHTYVQDTKYNHVPSSHPDAVELGGGGNYPQAPITQTSPATHTAELAGQLPREGDGLLSTHAHPTQPSELSGAPR